MKKKLLLTLLILFSIMLCSMAQSTVTLSGITYNVYENAATVISKSPKYSGNVVIPSSIYYRGKEYDVILIENGAFSGCEELTTIIIPNSVSSIGNYAFMTCTGLTSIIIPESITDLGPQAFQGCTGLTSITIPNSVTHIYNSAFYNCI